MPGGHRVISVTCGYVGIGIDGGYKNRVITQASGDVRVAVYRCDINRIIPVVGVHDCRSGVGAVH